MASTSEQPDKDAGRTSCAFNIRTDINLGAKIQKEAERRGETSSFVFREAGREYLARVDKMLKEADDHPGQDNHSRI